MGGMSTLEQVGLLATYSGERLTTTGSLELVRSQLLLVIGYPFRLSRTIHLAIGVT